jgi:hypothetical protein
MNLTTSTTAQPAGLAPPRGRLAALRDLAVILVCVALMVAFLARAWRTAPPQLRASSDLAAASVVSPIATGGAAAGRR